MSKDKFYIYKGGKCVAHRSPLKMVVDPLLIKLQWFTTRPWLIASKTSYNKNGRAHFEGYTFTRVKLQT